MTNENDTNTERAVVAKDALFGSWTSTAETMPPPMLQVLACVTHDLSGCKEIAILENIPQRHHLMQDDPDDIGISDVDGNNWWPAGWYSSLPQCGQQTGYDDFRFAVNEADYSVVAWMPMPIYGRPTAVIPGQYTGHVRCEKCGKIHWMHGSCSLPNAEDRRGTKDTAK